MGWNKFVAYSLVMKTRVASQNYIESQKFHQCNTAQLNVVLLLLINLLDKVIDYNVI